MKMTQFNRIIAVVTLFIASGCSGVHVRKYSGAVLSQSELALVFTQHIEGSQTKIFSLDGEDLPYTATRILELKPGSHLFSLFNSPWPSEKPGVDGLLKHFDLSPERHYAVFTIKANLRPGYTYVPVPREREPIGVDPARSVCLAEEPHDSPTARVNISGELRYPSSNAPLVGCAEPNP